MYRSREQPSLREAMSLTLELPAIIPACTEPDRPRIEMFCGLRRGNSCGNGVSCEEGPKGRAAGPWAHQEQRQEVQSHVFAAHCMVQAWSRSCVEVGCGARMGEHSVCYGKSNRHGGSATSAGFSALRVAKTV